VAYTILTAITGTSSVPTTVPPGYTNTIVRMVNHGASRLCSDGQNIGLRSH